MVHALTEIWRVLKPGGILVDLRPISSDSPLEIVSETRTTSAGHLDESPGRADDLAADEAVANAVQRGAFKQEQVNRFELAFYWKSLEDMKAYAQERWTNSIIIPAAVLERAETIIQRSDEPVRIRLPRTIHLAKYIKEDLSQ